MPSTIAKREIVYRTYIFGVKAYVGLDEGEPPEITD